MRLAHALVVSSVVLSCGRRGFDVDAALVDVTPADAAPVTNIAFVTSTAHLPITFGADLAGADAICATRAASAGLAGRYVAFVSASGVVARDRLAGARGWVRTDGRPFADRIDDLFSGKIYHPLRLDEYGEETAVAGPTVATGTRGDGVESLNCSNFTDSATTTYNGLPWGTTSVWFSVGADPCNQPFRLYCFGVDHAEPLVVQPATGRRAFVTVQPLSGGSGLAAADALCATEASAVGLSGSFRALLATTTASAASRFTLTGPTWVRLDGIPLAATPLAFANGTLATSLNVNSVGDYVGDYVFTGASSPVAVALNTMSTCADWTDANGVATVGYANRTDKFFNGTSLVQCAQQRIYCLEE